MPRVPDALVEPNAFTFQVNNFACTLAMSKHMDISTLLNASADLYVSTLQRDAFFQEFEAVKKERLGGMIRCAQNPNDLDPRSALGLDFTLQLIHIAMTEPWALPCLVTKYQDEICWHAGGNRLIASGLVYKDAMASLPILCSDYDRNGNKFQATTAITTDQELCNILGVDFKQYSQHSTEFTPKNCEIHLEWPVGMPGPCLHYVKIPRSIFDWSIHHEPVYIHDNISAIHSLLSNNKVQYYADNPEQVYDSTGFFDLEHAGPGLGTHEEIGPGGIVHHAYRVNRFDNPPAGKNILWVEPGRTIDLGELLFWVNTQHNVYADRDGTFLFMTADTDYNSTQICLSHQ